MSIIVSKNGDKAVKVDKTEFEKEDYLQEYIHMNPESIPVYEIQESKRLLVLAREFPTNSGPIDALAIDKDGDIYVIETKLYKNPDKRTVVAQALDYGASLWKKYYDFSDFLKVVDSKVRADHNISTKERITDFLDIEDDEEYSSLLDMIKTNLIQGNIKFVVLMDRMGERLKNLIIYVNQHSQFDIYAVQLEYYKIDQYEIIVPKLFGVESKKSTVSPPPRQAWNRENFLEDTRKRTQDKNSLKITIRLLDFAENTADSCEFGTGKGKGSFTYKFADERAKSGFVSLFTVWSDGNIGFRFGNIKNRLGDDASTMFGSMISKIIKVKNLSKNKASKKQDFTTSLQILKAFPSDDIIESFELTILKYIRNMRNIETV